MLFKTFNGEECWKRPSKNQTQKRRDKESGKNTVKRHVNCCIFVVTVNRENRPHFTKKRTYITKWTKAQTFEWVFLAVSVNHIKQVRHDKKRRRRTTIHSPNNIFLTKRTYQNIAICQVRFISIMCCI